MHVPLSLLPRARAADCYFSTGTTSSVAGVFDVMRVRVGAHNINDPELSIDVAEIIGHPGYVGSTFENDMTVMRLAEDIDPNLFEPVRLSW